MENGWDERVLELYWLKKVNRINSVWPLALQDQYEYPLRDSNYSMRISSRDVGSIQRVVRLCVSISVVVRVLDTCICIYTSFSDLAFSNVNASFARSIFLRVVTLSSWSMSRSYVLKGFMLQEPKLCASIVDRNNVATCELCGGIHVGMTGKNNIKKIVLFTT